MALVWIDGFEGYGATIGQAVAPAGCLARRYGYVNAGDSCQLQAGRLGGYSIAPTNAAWDIRTPA